MNNKTKKLFLIDGQGLIYRAFFAIPRLTTSYGQIINAAYGFTLLLFKLLEEQKPDGIIIAFDTPKPTFRHKQYEQYKAQREKMPQELIEQLPIIKEIVQKLNILSVEIEEYEADDIIGTIIQKTKDSEYKPIIVTGDKDLLQLADKDTEILLMQKGLTQVEQHHLKSLEKMLGFLPNLIPDYIGLKGDPSDNIPGVPGIGEKTAQKLIKQFGSLEEIIENSAGIESKSIREKLLQYKEQARLSKELAIIKKDVDFDLKPEEIAYNGPDYEQLKTLFTKYEFKKLLEKIPNQKKNSSKIEENSIKFQEITNEEELSKMCQKVMNKKTFSFLTETYQSGTAKLVKLIVIATTDEIFLIRIDNGDILIENNNLLSRKILLEKLKPLFLNTHIEKIGYDLKESWRYLYNDYNFFEIPYYDVKIASYLLNPSREDYSLNNIICEGLDMMEGNGANNEEQTVFSDRECELCWQAKSLLQLKEIQWDKLSTQEMDKLYLDVELPLIEVIYFMEKRGIKLDTVFLKKMSQQFSDKIAGIRTEIFNLSGEEFNLNSPKQLSQVLFEKMKLPALKKIKTGYSTNAKVLQELSEKHEVVAKILEYRELEKLKNTYIDKLPRLINTKTGRIHSCFNQTGTSTGRLSSNNPNLQNIPVRTELGKAIRNAFIAEQGNTYLSADYSQIELRILAHLSKDDNLREAFLEGKDIHAFTASQLFNIDLNLVSEEMRRIAKTINFGIIYGMSSFGLATNLRISRDEAAHYIEAYFQRYHMVKEYIEEQITIARKNKFVKTMLNRIRYLEGIDSPNKSIREFYERTAVNTPIQGTAADLIKIAMIGISSKMESLNCSSGLIIQIHDELIFEVPETELEKRQVIIKDIMENCLPLDIPLKVNFSNGHRWGEL